MDAEEMGMNVGFGVVMQFLRGFSWFGDVLTVLSAAVFGFAMAYTRHGPSLLMVGAQSTVHFFEVMSGLSIGHIASRHTKIVPKFNAYSQEPDDGQAVSD
jgi:hypothetical protein